MRVASLDLGTNTLLLTIADLDQSSLKPLYEDAVIIRLGQNLKDGGALHPDAKKRCLQAIENYLSIISSYDVGETIAVGTAALRKTSDGEQFVKEIAERYNINFEIISGKEEARLTFKSTQHEFPVVEKELLMFDIGGGSTEIVTGDLNDITSMTSLPVGTVNLTEEFMSHDPATPSEMATTGNRITDVLSRITVNQTEFKGVGVAGTVTTLKAISLKMSDSNHGLIHKSVLTRDEITELAHRLTTMTLKERLRLKGLPEKRADIIHVGAVITQAIVHRFGLSEIHVSDRGLRWGVLYDRMEKLS
tara:strand:+ start:2003 stop:2917 length:915 start_codon:yes stop_codon:yes gene_type:complete